MATILATTNESVEATSAAIPSWRNSLKSAVRSGRRLAELLSLPLNSISARAESDFPVFVPLEYIEKMEVGNLADPLLLQVLPTVHEEATDGDVDAVGDLAAQRSPGLLQKYKSRVLALVSGRCAVHCRYCFRRHYPYDAISSGRTGIGQSIATIAADPSIQEVILSGGDPLTLTDSVLSWTLSELNKIDHLRRIRLHTRVPVVIPQRVCPEMTAWVKSSRLPVYIVMHFNHVNEFCDASAVGMRQLRAAGATLLNQSVLLTQVNDSVENLEDLCLKLVDHHILPYYLHQLDPVQGALHFGVPDVRAQELVAELQTRLPGYALPKLVREEAGKSSKTSL